MSAGELLAALAGDLLAVAVVLLFGEQLFWLLFALGCGVVAYWACWVLGMPAPRAVEALWDGLCRACERIGGERR